MEAEVHAPKFSLAQKKFAFKLINEIKDRQDKTNIDAVWKKIMMLPDKQVQMKNSDDPVVESKAQLLQVILSLELDNLVMFSQKDGNIVLI